MSAYFMGLDNGGTAVKCVIFDDRGCEIAEASVKTPVLSPRVHFEERDMGELWEANVTVISACIQKSGVDPSDILGIGCTGHGKGLYLVDSAGAPAYYGIPSTDARAESVIEAWEASGVSDGLMEMTLHRPVACQPLPLLAWLKENEPEAYARIRYIFEAKDYIRFCLTGEAYAEITDYSGSGLMDLVRQDFNPRICEAVGMPELYCKFPPLRNSYDICGRVTPEVAEMTGLRAGTPVSGGMFDIDACALASGAISSGDLCSITGTWSINEYVSDHPVAHATTKNSLFCVPGYYLVEESSATSAGNLEWFIHLFGLRETCKEGSVYERINTLVNGISPTENTPVYVPFLYGTNESGRSLAALEGLSHAHTVGHILRAVYEGVVFSHYTHILRLLENRDPPAAIKLAGGAARSRIWVQMFADVCGLPVETVEVNELGTLGAAMSAAVAVGHYRDYHEAAERMVSRGELILPNMENHGIYMEKYQRYAVVARKGG
ncbi:MAG: carbohydrate kinase [Oscillospiraceae bacterium]|nr:MAG: carbohydrate kinase [Oscillospiraceae bacterium]